MKKLLIGIILIVASVAGIMWIANNKHATDPYATYAAVQGAVASGAKLYDVRTASEFSEAHFPSAVNWSLQDIQAGTLPDVSKDTIIFVYCHSGNRSGQATTILREAGYAHVVDLHGLDNVQSLGGVLQ